MVDDVVVHYHMADFFDSQRYVGIRYDDPLFGVDWPVEPAHISERDRAFPDFDPRCV
jgi:dTDP-4-dehydrorhamnose 3,5-epimerase